MAGAADFPRLQNLAFYSGYNPKYFYYSSLKNFRYPDDTEAHSAYNAEADRISAEVTGALSATPLPSFASSEDTLATAKIDELISFIDTAIEYERENERNYFKLKIQHLNDIKELRKMPEMQDLIASLNSSTFDYNKVIALINVVQQGLDAAKTVAKYEQDRLKDLYTRMGQMTKAHVNQIKGVWKARTGTEANGDSPEYIKFLKESLERRRRHIALEYVNHGNLYSSKNDSAARKKRRVLGAKKYLEDLQGTVDVRIGEWVTKSAQTIINSSKTWNELSQYILTFYDINKYSQPDLETRIKGHLARALTAFTTAHLGEILTKQYDNLDADELADILLNDSSTPIEFAANLNIEGVYDNFGVQGQQLALFEKGLTLMDVAHASTENLYDVFSKVYARLNRRETLDEDRVFRRVVDMKKYTELVRLVNLLEAALNRVEKGHKDLATALKEVNSFTKKNQFKAADGGENVTLTFEVDPQTQEINIDKFNQQLKQTALFKVLGSGTEAKSLRGIIAGLKTRIGHRVRSDIVDGTTRLLNSSKKQLGLTEKHILAAVNKSLTNIHISVGGPTYSEVKQGFQDRMGTDLASLERWAGRYGEKNDFVVVVKAEYDVPDLTKDSAIKNTIDNTAEYIAEGVGQLEEKNAQQLSRDFVNDFYDALSHLNKTDSDFNDYDKKAALFFKNYAAISDNLEQFGQLSDKIREEWKNYNDAQLAQNKKQDEIIERAKATIKELESSFFVSSTMKTYNQYQNRLGFVGGSIGADLNKQLDNIEEIFNGAGMSFSQDRDWLYSAIINCSPISIVGEKYKNIIEDYLGSLAAFMLFDEGGAEVRILDSIRDTKKQRIASPEILHLYAVNGVYVPGSYVLTKVREELEQCRTDSYKAYEATREGAGIMIVNTMNEGLVPNRNRSKNTRNNEALDTDPWGTVAAAAPQHVSLQILFLAGFMDIVQHMNETLADIELPQ